MKALIIAAAGLAFTAGAVMAQQPYQQSSDRAATATSGENMSRPAVGMGSKTMSSCTADKQKFCASASDYMTKECLVKNWDVIASDCQDALGKPFDGAAPHRE
jgi:hypothetical protein